jgi:hypothetical protein
MPGYICPYCLSDSDGPVGPDGCNKCDDYEDQAFEQAQSDFWEDTNDFGLDDDLLDLEDFV